SGFWGNWVAKPSTYRLYRQNRDAMRTVSCISISLAPRALADSMDASVTFLPPRPTSLAIVSRAFILSLTGADSKSSLTFSKMVASPNSTSVTALWAEVQNVHSLSWETMEAINSLSPKDRVEGPRSRIWVRSRIGPAVSLRYSRSPVIPGKCDSKVIWGMSFYFGQ